MDWLRGFLSKAEIDLYLDPVESLTGDFLADMEKAAARQRLVLMMDTYEQIGALDEWVRTWVKALHTNVLVVIAGRRFPGEIWERAWPRWMAHALMEELRPMTDEDLRTLVTRYYRMIQAKEPEPAQVEAVVRFARGLPLVATVAARLWASYGVMDFQAVKAQVTADLVDRLLEGVSENMGQLVEAAASLRWFDQAILRKVLAAEVIDADYRELRHFPFVRPVMVEKLAVHDVVRGIIDENLRTQDPERHKMWHERVATYFEQAMIGAEEDERERFLLEWLYHRTRANETMGLQLFQKTAEELTRYRLINRLRALMTDVNTYHWRREGSRLWREYYDARLAHLQGRWADAEKVYQSIGENEKAEPKLRAYALCDWGDLLVRYWRLGEPQGVRRAVEVIERSLGLGLLDSHLNEGFFRLARAARYQAQWDRERHYLEQPDALQNSEVTTMVWRTSTPRPSEPAPAVASGGTYLPRKSVLCLLSRSPATISPIPDGMPLMEAESIARKRESGDGSPQKTVVEHIVGTL